MGVAELAARPLPHMLLHLALIMRLNPRWENSVVDFPINSFAVSRISQRLFLWRELSS